MYNAAAYVKQAVESALAQPEAAEVILVEDRSPDNSLEVCRALAEKHPKVTLLQHPGGVNRGAGPSRNLGMKNSRCSFIAFLDADDFYLPERFTAAARVFDLHPDCDGVYDAVGIHFENEASKTRWSTSNMGHVRVTTIENEVSPEDLFRVLIKGGSGHIHLNGLVIKRGLLDKCGYMNEQIADTLHEDTDFILKAAAVGRLLTGSPIEPTSLRRVHTENRVSAPRSSQAIYHDQMRLRMATYRWCRQQGLREQRKLAFRRALSECILNKPLSPSKQKKGKYFRNFLALCSWVIHYPEVISERYYWTELASSFWGWIRYG